MCPITYYTMIRSKQKNFDVRVHLVRMALTHGIREASRTFGCSRNTTRKWLRRFQEQGPKGLRDRSRAPNSCPHKTPPEVENIVVKQRKRTPGFGARRMKEEFELTPSVGAIGRIIRQRGLTRKRKKKSRVKRDLRVVKQQYRPLTHFQMDVKYLDDIPNYWPYMKRFHLPQFQYTIRCVRTGAVFLTYGDEISATYAELTVRRFLLHLQQFGINLAEVVIQTDRGGEFGGNAVTTDCGFSHTIENIFGAYHRLLLRYNPNANADVESFHAHEETEFFDVQSFQHPRDFWDKITSYQHYWNLARKNSYKNYQTPLEILTKADPHIPPQILLLHPINLDTLLPSQVGHHVPVQTG